MLTVAFPADAEAIARALSQADSDGFVATGAQVDQSNGGLRIVLTRAVIS